MPFMHICLSVFLFHAAPCTVTKLFSLLSFNVLCVNNLTFQIMGKPSQKSDLAADGRAGVQFPAGTGSFFLTTFIPDEVPPRFPFSVRFCLTYFSWGKRL
jgi:hypothetical protein